MLDASIKTLLFRFVKYDNSECIDFAWYAAKESAAPIVPIPRPGVC